MEDRRYLMESNDEVLRLDMKTFDAVTERQARWAGLAPGMRVADLGCGAGKTTSKLAEITQPGGSAVGVDLAEQRVSFAREHYGNEYTTFEQRNILEPITGIGEFDFIWMRFVLEYHRSRSFEIVKNVIKLLNPGAILCLIDLDYNCLSHYGMSGRMERAIQAIMKRLEEEQDFDPYVGRKLYSYLYDLGFEKINVNMEPHHLIYGELTKTDDFNWTKKVEVAAKNSGYDFNEYQGGYEEFLAEYRAFFADPRRLTYTPMFSVRGIKP